MASLNAVLVLSQKDNTNLKTDLSKQLIQKLNILGSYANGLQNVVTIIKKSQRLIDIKGVTQYQNSFKY